jgi:hypothetical protein
MGKKTKFLLIFMLIFFLFSNLISPIFRMGSGIEYQTYDGRYKAFEMPSKGATLEMVERNFNTWKVNNNIPDSTILYRTTPLQVYKFWNWVDYLAHLRRWRHPYLNITNSN